MLKTQIFVTRPQCVKEIVVFLEWQRKNCFGSGRKCTLDKVLFRYLSVQTNRGNDKNNGFTSRLPQPYFRTPSTVFLRKKPLMLHRRRRFVFFLVMTVGVTDKAPSFNQLWYDVYLRSSNRFRNFVLCCRKCWQVWIALTCQATPAPLRICHMLLKTSSFEEKNVKR